MKHMQHIVTGLAVVLLLSLMVPAAFAGQSGPISGSFTAANVAPTVTVLEIYSDAGLGTVANNLTPQVMYYVKVTAGDVNTIDDITQIEVQLFYDATPSNPNAPGVANTQTDAIFTWTKTGDAWAVSAGAGTTWAITSGSSTRPSTMTASSGDWVFAITPGKVATESPGADNWDVYAKATDAASATGTRYTRDKEMLWYGQISTAASAGFGSVTPGTGFADGVNEVGSISVNYIANGDYDKKVKSDDTWTGASNNATYDDAGTTGTAQEFSLKAYPSDTFGSAVQVTVAGASIDATGTQTAEAGTTVAANTLWLKVATVFTNDTYSGNITYIIENR